MKIREWSQRILWFVLGAVSIGFLISVSTAYGKRTEMRSILVPAEDLERRVTSLENRVGSIEAREDARAKEEQKANRPCRGKDCD